MTKNYGWTSFKREGWVSEDGSLKLYRGCFRDDHDPNDISLVVIPFWTNRPVLAMREIVRRLNNEETVPGYSVVRIEKGKSGEIENPYFQGFPPIKKEGRE